MKCYCDAGKVRDLKKIEGILWEEGYLDIIQNNAIPSAHHICQGQFIFQENNDQKHSFKLCIKYLESLEKEMVFKKMFWPSQSPKTLQYNFYGIKLIGITLTKCYP